jgi:HD-GYP domain-containing protein (c-di-GMP phosphodiesterase class II)
MKKYKTIFSSFHTIYRLITTSGDIKNFAAGIGRLYKNTFKVDRVTLIFKNINSHSFMKISIKNKKYFLKKGGISILTHKERGIVKREKEVLTANTLIYPFIFADTLGVVSLRRLTHGNDFSELDKKWFLSLSEEVSVGLKIFNLYREQKKLIINYVKSLTKLLDQYVPTSYIHVKSIFRLIRAIGKELRLSTDQIKSIEYASLLHDAGKIQLPSGILKKETPLTDEEFKMIMRHPHTGVEMIKDLEALKPVMPIILHHHERFDGQGYPSGLKEEEIPIGSRILSVLDAFDAMFFGRPYKKKKQLKEIERELTVQTNRQFDPKIVDVFLRIIRRESIKKYLNSFL